MNCPYCDGSSKVVDSRPIPDGTRRRRQCDACGRRFTTHERLAPAEIRVIKRPGRAPEPFDADKIARALLRVAGGDRPGEAAVFALARRIEAELVDEGATTVRAAELARRVLEHLHEIDRLAATRFAADYTDLDGRLDFERRGEAGEGEEDEQLGLFTPPA